MSDPGIGHNTVKGLKAYIDRIEVLEGEKKSYADDIKEVYGEAKKAGFDPKAMRAVVRLRKQDMAKREELEAQIEVYLRALGMV